MIKNLVFDFGGVIVDINRDNAVRHFESLGLTNAEELLDKYHQRDIFLEVEDGRIDETEFCRKLGEYCHRDISFKEAKAAWLAFFVGDPQYRLDYLEELHKKYNIYILSNTNPFVMSWARSPEFTAARKPLDYYVDKVFTSYQVKCVKPHREIFEYMINDTQLDPAESLFIDDGAANVEIGKELGFHVLQPVNGEDWREKLNRIL
ncbi:HAD family phosphatase [Bacteroides sp. 51]|uniref:HAD family hydrolase n=1 Tax=Bacteroides sp. 51 TaxID=2302938 RepID=UPI0013D3D889|nr:HAD family phosphatase [Bacteroides sp. 51]NDV82799.1 HAD family phosphatase [Bacteroides sp. 51]